MEFGTQLTSSTGVVNLQKGQRVDLKKVAPSLKKIMVGLGWDANKYSGSFDFDLDASVFMADGNNKTKATEFIFYNNLKDPSGSVEHLGDNRTGDGDGDDEQIIINLDKVPDHIQKIAVTVTIYEADERNQNFGLVENSYIRLVDETTGQEVVRYDLCDDFSVETAIVVGELYKKDGSWRFAAVGSGFSGGLAALCHNYGLQTE